MTKKLEGRVALVTGGGRGLGAIYAQALAENGAKVAVADIDYEGALRVAEEIHASGAEALAVSVDISAEDNVAQAVAEVTRRFGKIDILVNNAGLFGGLKPRKLEEISVEEWDRVMAVNMRGTFLVTRAVVPIMKKNEYGKIINISSSTVLNGSPYLTHYVTSKGGVIGFTRALTRELGQSGIRINTITPGLTITDASKEVIPQQRHEVVARERALSRLQMPSDLVGAVLFLSSSESDFITGQTINVDGGHSLY